MGLDTVELILAIEDAFDVDIPNADASKLAVLGDMHAYLVQALRLQGDAADENEVWEKLKAIVVHQLGAEPENVTPSAHIVLNLNAD